MKPKQDIFQIIEGYLSDEILEDVWNLPCTDWMQSGILTAEGTAIDTDIRNCVRSLYDLYAVPKLYNIIRHAIEVFNVEKELCYNISGINQIERLEYGVGGKYEFHTDTTELEIEPVKRRITCIIQVSDPNDYTGGDLRFKKIGLTDYAKESMRKKGTIILFPSDIEHTVEPLTSGKRRSIVSWGVGRP